MKEIKVIETVFMFINGIPILVYKLEDDTERMMVHQKDVNGVLHAVLHPLLKDDGTLDYSDYEIKS